MSPRGVDLLERIVPLDCRECRDCSLSCAFKPAERQKTTEDRGARVTGTHRCPQNLSRKPPSLFAGASRLSPVTVGVARTARPPPRDYIAMKAIKVETPTPIRFRWRGTVYLATATTASAWLGLPGSCGPNPGQGCPPNRSGVGRYTLADILGGLRRFRALHRRAAHVIPNRKV